MKSTTANFSPIRIARATCSTRCYGKPRVCGVAVLTDHRVHGVLPENHRFTLVNSHGSLTAERLVLATGGRSLPKSGSDGTGYDIAQVLGHTIVPTTPALAPLTLDDGELHRQLSGISHDAELTVWVDAASFDSPSAVRCSGRISASAVRLC